MSSSYLSKRIHQQIAELAKLVDIANLDGISSLTQEKILKLVKDTARMEKKLLRTIMFGLHYPKTRSLLELCRTNFQCSPVD